MMHSAWPFVFFLPAGPLGNGSCPTPAGLFVFPRRWKVIDTKQNDLLTRNEVLDLLSIRRSASYQLMESHGFPHPIKVLEQSNRS